MYLRSKYNYNLITPRIRAEIGPTITDFLLGDDSPVFPPGGGGQDQIKTRPQIQLGQFRLEHQLLKPDMSCKLLEPEIGERNVQIVSI